MRSKPLEYHDDHYTLFHKVNTNVFLPNGKIGDLSNQHMPQGTLPQALNMQISIDQKDNITLTWTNHLEYIASYDNSRLGIIAMYNHRSFRPRLIEGAPQPERPEFQTNLRIIIIHGNPKKDFREHFLWPIRTSHYFHPTNNKISS